MAALTAAHMAPDYDAAFDESSEEEETGPTSSPLPSESTDVERIESIATIKERPVIQRRRSSRLFVGAPPVGFWHTDLNGVRLHVLHLWARTILIVCAFVVAVLSLFWAVLFRIPNNLHHLNIWVVDFDGRVTPYLNETPIVGPHITQLVQRLQTSNQPQPDWQIRDPSAFNNDPMQVREGVYHRHAWAAVIINANATGLLRAALEQSNSSYDPAGCAQLIELTARDQTTTQGYIAPYLTALRLESVATFGPIWAGRVMQNSSIPRQNIEAAPQALSPAIGFTTFDLRPFGPAVATPAVSIGLIYLIVLSFFSFTFFLPIHMKYLLPRGHPPLHFYQLVIWRYVATVGSYFIISLCYSLVSLAFLVPMSRQPAPHTEVAANPSAYGRATFVVYWMINFVGMVALGLASENAAMFLGTPWVALWLIFWIITNVSTAFYAIPLASDFYKWGYAWPLHHVVEATRSTLFDLHSRIGLNFGVLLAWCALNSALYPLCCYYMRWMTARKKAKAAAEDAKWCKKMQEEKERPGLFTRVTTGSSRK